MIRRVCGVRVVEADLTRDGIIAGMAARALSAATGLLVPIGFSMGGNVALEMARQAPERITAIALIDVNPAADLPARAAIRLDDQAQVRNGQLSDVLERVIHGCFAHDTPPAAHLRSLVREMADGLGPDVFLRQSEALRLRADCRAVVASFDGQMLLVCGADDQLCSPVIHRAMAQDARNATLRVIEGAGHMLPLEQPERLGAALCAWIDEAVLRPAGKAGGGRPAGNGFEGGRIAC